MLVDGYIRVSQVAGRSGPSFVSPDLQRERIERWCALSGAQLATVHVELDESGANPNRPMLQAALERVEAGQTRGIVVARMDRFGRSLLHSLAAIERIDRAGGTFVSVDDGLDLSTNTGRLVLRIMLSLAEYELDRIRDSWRDSMRKAIERGVHVCATPPTGYTRKAGEPLKLNPATAPYIHKLFERRAEGEGLADLARWLKAEGVRTSTDAVGWDTATLSNVIANRVYVGEAHWGEFIRPGAHPAIVDASLWQRAQQPRQVNVGRRSHDALLAGFVRCASCRRKAHRNHKGRDKGTVAYVCGRHHAAGVCPHGVSVTVDKLDRYVADALLAHLAKHRPAAAGKLAAAHARLEQAEAAVARYRDNATLEVTLGRERYAAGLSNRVRKAQTAALELASLRAKTSTAAVDADGWAQLTVAQRRALIAEHIDVIIVYHGRLRVPDRTMICWRGEGPPDLPRRGHGMTAIKAFSVDQCLGDARTRTPPRAFQPRWPVERLERELRASLVGKTYLGIRHSYERRGLGDLYAEMELQGGRTVWADRLGLPLRAVLDHPVTRTDEELAQAVRDFIGADATQLPCYKDFKDGGQVNLYKRMWARGGIDHWAQRIGVDRAPSKAGRWSRPDSGLTPSQ